MTRRFFCLVVCLLMLGCATVPKQANQTLAGMDSVLVLISAQHSLAKEGYDVESIDAESGTLTTQWEVQNNVQTQYKVEVVPAENLGIDGVEVKVSAQRKEKTVAGWSKPQNTATANLDEILKDIVALAVKRFGATGVKFAPSPTAPEPAPAPEPECSATADCRVGMYCNDTGECASDCSDDVECGEGNICDPTGRCVATPEEGTAPAVEGGVG